MKKSLLLIILTFNFTGIWCQWQKGNGPYGGLVKVLAQSDSYLVAGCNWNESGVFVSNNKGNTWTKVVKTDKPSWQIPDISVNEIVKGTVPDVFYIASSGEGVYKLFKTNNTWEIKTIGFRTDSKSVESVAFHKNSIYATIFGTGVYKTMDEGLTWSLCDKLTSKYTVNLKICGDTIFAGGSDGLFYSKDDGTTWNSFSSVLNGKYVTKIFFNAQFLFLAVFNEGTYVFSKDGKLVMTPLEISQNQKVVPIALVNGKLYGNHNLDGLFVSEIPSLNWQKVTNGPENKRPLCAIAVKDTILVGTEGFGIYRSADKGISWKESSKGICAFKYISIKTMNKIIFAATNINGIFASHDNGNNWKRINNNLGGNISATDFLVKDSLLFLATNGLFISKDTGKHWQQVENVFATSLSTNGKKVYAAWMYGGIKSTSDNGKTWETVNFTESDKMIEDIDARDSILLVGTYKDGPYYSSDYGKSFKQINKGLVNLASSGVLIKGSLFFITTGCTSAVCENLGVFRSSDFGANWEKKNNGLCCIPTELILTDTIIFGAFPQTVIYSSNNGENWYSTSSIPALNSKKSTLSDPAINLQSIGSNKEYLFAGTDNGFYFQPIRTLFMANPTNSLENHETFSLNNYPNPFNEITTISYTLTKDEKTVTLSVYNPQGKTIFKLNEKNKPAGHYSIPFEVPENASGVYIYTLTTSQGSSSGKMIIK